MENIFTCYTSHMQRAFLEEFVKKEFKLEDNFLFGPPEIKSHGHLSTNAAFALAKIKKISPMAAGELVRDLVSKKFTNEFSKIDVIAPGFVNFWFSDESIGRQFKNIYKNREKLGKPESSVLKYNKTKKVIVEYPSPNIGKPMHVGHMRSTIIGDAIANIHDFLGYKVIRWNYIGDWGTQFGKLIYAYKRWGNKVDLRKNPITSLLGLYIKFHNEAKKDESLDKEGQTEFKKLEEGNLENRRLWQLFTKESLKELNKIFKTLDIKFDVTLGESFYEEKLKPLINEFLEKGIAMRSEGSLIINLNKFNLQPALIQKSDGASLYLTREIANLEYRVKKYKPAKILYVVGNEQSLHFEQLFAIAKILGLDESELSHIKHGLVLGEDGKKLSTREGRIVVFEDLIKKSIELAYLAADTKNPKLPQKDKKKISEIVGIGALKYNDLSQNRNSNIGFDWDILEIWLRTRKASG